MNDYLLHKEELQIYEKGISTIREELNKLIYKMSMPYKEMIDELLNKIDIIVDSCNHENKDGSSAIIEYHYHDYGNNQLRIYCGICNKDL